MSRLMDPIPWAYMPIQNAPASWLWQATPGCRWWVVRVAWLCDTRGQNFMQTMLRLGQSGKALRVVNDQHGVPTFARPFAEALLKLAAHPNRSRQGLALRP